MKEEKDLDSYLPENFPNCDFSKYWEFEKKVLQYLAEEGIQHGTFFTVERDSFGPLVRGIKIESELYTYG